MGLLSPLTHLNISLMLTDPTVVGVVVVLSLLLVAGIYNTFTVNICVVLTDLL